MESDWSMMVHVSGLTMAHVPTFQVCGTALLQPVVENLRAVTHGQQTWPEGQAPLGDSLRFSHVFFN